MSGLEPCHRLDADHLQNQQFSGRVMKSVSKILALVSALCVMAPLAAFSQAAPGTVKLTDGQGNNVADYNITAPGLWTFKGGISGGGGSITGLPSAPSVSITDQPAIVQSGIGRLATMSQVASLFGITLPTINLGFATSSYQGIGCATLVACTTTTNSGGYAQWADGHWSLFSANTPRLTDKGVLREFAGVNLALWNRDLSQNSAWTRSGTSAALTATGIDNTGGAATTLAATGSNGTACQSITNSGGSFGEYTYSAFIRRITGSGEVDMSLETAPGHTGTEYYPITGAGRSPALSSVYQRFQLTFDNMSNPTVCFRIVTPGDSIAVDFVQVENQVWATSPMYSTNVGGTRAVDIVQLTGAAATLLNSGTSTVIATETGVDAGAFRHQIAPPLLGGSVLNLYGWL
jgi:hypothetical protein